MMWLSLAILDNINVTAKSETSETKRDLKRSSHPIRHLASRRDSIIPPGIMYPNLLHTLLAFRSNGHLVSSKLHKFPRIFAAITSIRWATC